MKVKLILHKEFEVDFAKDHNHDMLVEALHDTGVEGTADSDDIHDAIREILDTDLDGALIELSDICVDDFKIEVPNDFTLQVPEKEGD